MIRVYGCVPIGAKPTLIGSAVPYTFRAAQVDVLPGVTYVDNQIGSCCVGEGFEGGRHIATKGVGKRGSPHGIYTAARARQRATRLEPLHDQGCDPHLAADALVATGIYPRDEKDDDPSAINDIETFAEAERCAPFAMNDLAPINPGDVSTIDRWLTAGFGVVTWFQVDQAFEDLAAGAVWPGPTGPILGGHCTVFAGYTSKGDYLDWNSWSKLWANSGIGIVSRSFVASGRAGLCAVIGGPVLS